jgi:basic amino acid/polyamine antiporter, APA family
MPDEKTNMSEISSSSRALGTAIDNKKDNGDKNQGKLKKEIGLFTLVAIGVGSIIGSGMFAMPAVMGSVAGPALVLAIIFVGIITTFLAITYAELGSAFPLTGGPYSLPRLALGDQGGFVMGWGYFLYAFIGTAAIIDIFITYLGYYIPGLAVGETLTPIGILIAVIALWIFTAINVVGVKWGGLYSVVTTVGKIIPLLLFAGVGLAFFNFSNFNNFFAFGVTGITLAMAFEFWAFVGFESVVITSEEVKNPGKTIPRAMLLTIGIVIAVYVFIAISFTGLINWQGLGFATGDWGSIGNLSSPLSDVAKAASLPILAAIATIGALISTAGAGGDWVLLQGRIPYAMAKDKLFWAPMKKIHPKYGTPFLSLILASFLTMIIQIAIPNFPSVALIASITALVPYAAASISVPILRKTRPNVPRPFKLPYPIIVAGIGFIFATLLLYWASWPWTIVGGILMLIGFPLFLLVKNPKIEFKRTAWIWVYIIGIIIVSFLGDTNYIYDNFLPIGPQGIIVMPYDIILLIIFAIIIYAWAYVSNSTKKIIASQGG